MELKFKALESFATLPFKANPGDAGIDLVATSKQWDTTYEVLSFGTSLAVEIPPGYVGLLFPRSSIYKTDLSLANSVGVIDSGYRGEIVAKFYPGRPQVNYAIGDRVVQLVVVPYLNVNPVFVDELSSTERGSGGFGSSGT